MKDMLKKMKKSIIFCSWLLIAFSLTTGCGMFTSMVRTSYANQKIAVANTENNLDRFAASSFLNYCHYKADLRCDFEMEYFQSYSYHYTSSYSSTDIDIYSSLLKIKNYFVTMGNVLKNHYTEENDRVRTAFYFLEKEIVMSKKLYLEVELDKALLTSPGRTLSDKTNKSIEVNIMDRTGKKLFSNFNGDDSFVDFEVVSANNKQVYAKWSGKLGSPNGKATYNVYEGELWLKL